MLDRLNMPRYWGGLAQIKAAGQRCVQLSARWEFWLAAVLSAAALMCWALGGVQHKPAPMPEMGRAAPLIFIGGPPKSGTTLLRAILDAHPDVRCGPQTRVIPRILQKRQYWMKAPKEIDRLEEGGVSKTVLDNAIAAFCYEVIARHGYSAARLCDMDPLVLKMGTYVLDLFPNAKFLFVIRDARATVHTVVSQKKTVPEWDEFRYMEALTRWNNMVKIMYRECMAMGPDKCLIVRYETLVVWPRETLEQVLSFLDLPWNEAVLYHERYINKPNGVILSDMESASVHVKRPVYLDDLAKWVGQIPMSVLVNITMLAPMLPVLGYDPWVFPPQYGNL